MMVLFLASKPAEASQAPRDRTLRSIQEAPRSCSRVRLPLWLELDESEVRFRALPGADARWPCVMVQIVEAAQRCGK